MNTALIPWGSEDNFLYKVCFFDDTTLYIVIKRMQERNFQIDIVHSQVQCLLCILITISGAKLIRFDGNGVLIEIMGLNQNLRLN